MNRGSSGGREALSWGGTEKWTENKNAELILNLNIVLEVFAFKFTFRIKNIYRVKIISVERIK
jgi:hypothetical protein